MSEMQPRRSQRRSQRTEQLYNARALPQSSSAVPDRLSRINRPLYENQPAAAPSGTEEPQTRQSVQAQRTVAYGEGRYTPNEPEPMVPQMPVSQPAEQPLLAEPEGEQAPSVDRAALTANLSAYYRRAANIPKQEEEDPFAPLEWQPQPPRVQAIIPESQDEPAAPMNVYRPLEASWAQEETQQLTHDGYQVLDEEHHIPRKRRRQKRIIRRVIIAVVLTLAVAGALFLYWHSQQPTPVSASETLAPTPTPQPVRGYDETAASPIAENASRAISEISGNVSMSPRAVTEDNILTSSQRQDGLYDFYLFTAGDGRLLAYFDGLSAHGMRPMEGGFHVQMPPYLVTPEGKAMLALEGLEGSIGHSLTAGAMRGGWARLTAEDGESNFINPEGQLLSRLWFCRSFPFSGSWTVGYVDTGIADSAARYTLYAVCSEGEGRTVKWQDAADTQGVVASANGMAYLQNGEIHLLSGVEAAAAPLYTTDEAAFYIDCAATVLRDPQSGKYALYVQGQQHYDFVYDSIQPVESDILWHGDVFTGAAGQATVLYVAQRDYPMPRSHYFALTRDGATEYVTLSAVSAYPVIPD